MSDEASKTPEWVRLKDGSQMPFDADRICRSLFAATESLAAPNAFLARELTDAVTHFLAQDLCDAVPTTVHIAEQIEKVVRELGHPALARRFTELQSEFSAVRTEPTVAIRASDSPSDVVRRSLEAYSLSVVFSRDLHAAVEEGLLQVSGLSSPDTLPCFVVDARILGGDAWWQHWDEWKSCGAAWVVDSPEWLSILTADRSPIIRLCERIIALPRAAGHPVELHLNVAEPPSWIRTQGIGPLFADSDDPSNHSLRFGLQDMLLDQCLSMRDADVPGLAWHINGESWRDESQRSRLKTVVRHAMQGKAVRFVFDRPQSDITLAEGMERKHSGVLFEVAINLAAFARRSEINQDGVTLLRKLPSLARMAVSAAVQKRNYLRNLPESAPLKRGFLIERATCVVALAGLDDAVQSITGTSLSNSQLSLEFSRQIVQVLHTTLEHQSLANNLELRLDGHLPAPTRDATPRRQIEIASPLHACAGAGTMTLILGVDLDPNLDGLVELLRWTCESTSVRRMQLERPGSKLHQGELLPI